MVKRPDFHTISAAARVSGRAIHLILILLYPPQEVRIIPHILTYNLLGVTKFVAMGVNPW